jgi:hypothetical protein
MPCKRDNWLEGELMARSLRCVAEISLPTDFEGARWAQSPQVVRFPGVHGEANLN